MAKLRRLDFSELAFNRFMQFHPSDAETDAVILCFEQLLADPLLGEPVRFANYEGGHRCIGCSRFLFVYQFSDLQVRIKESLLRETYP